MSDNIKPPQELEIDIPRGALVQCPLRKHNLVSIAAFCKGCQVCGGLLDVMNGVPDKVPMEVEFSKRYRVNCNAPRVLEILGADLGEKG